jgi:outer membrane biosynthesis protein TonB
MENTFVVNEEPITIKITIEVIPGKKKEEIAAVKAPIVETPKKDPTVEVAAPTLEESEMTFEPINTPTPVVEKKKRAYTRKAKPTEEVVKEEPVEEKKPTEEPPVVEEVKKVEPVNKPVTSTNPNKVVARLAQMIRFYCKASNIPTTEITKKYLIDHGAADIIEGATEEDIEEAFKEVVKK